MHFMIDTTNAANATANINVSYVLITQTPPFLRELEVPPPFFKEVLTVSPR